MFRNLRWMPMVAVLALAAGACSDNGTDPVDPGNFDPVATEQAVQDLQNRLNDDSDIMVSLGLVSQGLGMQMGASRVLPRELNRAPVPFSARVVQGFSMSASSAEPVFPPELLGLTFEWNSVEGQYLPTERTGAPVNGMRFILYAIDPLTRVPVEPLVETGFLDLTDEGVGDAMRVGLYAESGGTALVDYFIQLTYALVGQSDISVTASAEGFISDGTDQLDFALSQGATLLGSTETIEMDLVYSLSLAGQNVSVTLEMHGEFDFSGETPLDAAMVDLRVQNGTEFVDFEMSLGTDNTLTGVIQYNGVTVVNITGTEADPVFTRADGEALTLEEVAALVDLFDMIEDVLDLVEDVFEPFGGLGL
jgi:hypothetical protein